MAARFCVFVLFAAQSAFALLLVAGHSRFSGRVLVAISPTHGVDAGDLPVMVLWVVCTICCAVLWRATGRR